MTILRIQIGYQRFPRLNLSFMLMLVRACRFVRPCAAPLRSARRNIDVRGMRPAPGIERAAYCEEGCWDGDEPVPHRQLAIKDFLS
jgi:hypothetical protein